MARYVAFESIGHPYKTIIRNDEIKPLGSFTTITPTDLDKETYVAFYNEGRIYIEENGKYTKIAEWVNPHRDNLPSGTDWWKVDALINWRPPTISYSFPKSSTFKIIYTGNNAWYIADYSPSASSNLPYTITFTVAVVENHLPLKTITITDTLNRLFEICEPIKKWDTPRYYLNSKQAEEFDKIQADEFVFTKQTLRECLQDIGKQIHGEPRAKPVKKDGKWVWEISFDMYQKQKKGIFFRDSLKNTATETLENYATHFDVNAENLINKQGQVIEPASNGFRSIRTETTGIRIEDNDNAIIETQEKIYEVKKLEWTDGTNTYDLTPYLFENNEYNTQLSTHSEAFPYSRAYGIKYTQGEKNITNLFFKIENGVFDSFKTYAIINIIRKVTGNTGYKQDDYTAMSFRVTYTPFTKARVLQSKPYYKDTKWEYGSIYTQQSNLIEPQNLGEVLKGAIARQNNTEKQLTFYLARQCELPKIGEMYDDDYYITNVNTQILPIGFKSTITISKNYNRLSEYVGIPNQRRFSQVSDTEAYERNYIIREYVVIGDRDTEDDKTMISLSSYAFIYGLNNEITGNTYDSANKISCIVFQGVMKSGSQLTRMQLPVNSAGVGNSLSFRASLKDNYSAGSTTSYVKNGDVEGYYQMEASYGDYYGRMYYLDFALYTNGQEHSTERARKLPIKDNTFLSADARLILASGTSLAIIHKDSREQLSFTFQIDFVTNRENFLIGSGLAKNSPFIVGQNTTSAECYSFPKKIPKFAKTYREVIADYTDEEKQKIKKFSISGTEHLVSQLKVMFGNVQEDSESWGVFTKETITQKRVEDTSGQELTETTYNGGELLFGENVTTKKGDKISDVYFTPRRYIYNRNVWIDKK